MGETPLPQLAEEVLDLIDKDPEIPESQRMLLRLAASLISENSLTYEDWEAIDDPRLRFTVEDADLFPDRWEIIDGRASPKVLGHAETEHRVGGRRRTRM